jgi:predicted nuclease of predicted toxin-antitoxin system
VKLLFDENLSPRLPQLIAKSYPDSLHVCDCGLKSATDAEVWEYAKANGYTIVSKDFDFQERSILWGPPPKVIWVRMLNCKSAEVAEVLSASRLMVERFIEYGPGTCLVLGR